MADACDKVVIVTGASSGIGQATARLLAAAGAKVMVAARREDRLKQLVETITSAGGTAELCVTDVADRSQVERLAAVTLQRFGRIDVLVNNAGVMPTAPMVNDQVDQWELMVDVNIKGVLYGIHAVLGHMLERGEGHIVNVASIAGHIVFPGFAVYCGTKHAVRAISEGLRQETTGKVRVTTVSPGAVATELVDKMPDAEMRQALAPVMEIAIDPEAIGRAIVFAISQPADVAVNEIVVRPAAQQA